jgi:uncharacterized phage protein gp47/JayE
MPNIPTDMEFPNPYEAATEEVVLGILLDEVHPDFNKTEGDFVYDMLAPVSVALADYYAAYTGWLSAAFPATATGTSLDVVASAWGLARITDETDDRFRARLLARLESPIGGGTAADWTTWVLGYPTVDIVYVRVIPTPSGPGTVEVQVAADDGSGGKVALTGPELTALEAYLVDFTPAGADLTVSTITTQAIDVVATVEMRTGFNNQTSDDAIELVIENWILESEIGAELVRMELIQQIMAVAGAYDITTLTIEGGTVNVDLAAGVAATVGTITVTTSDYTPG